MNYQFDLQTIPVQVEVGDSNHKFSFVKNGVTHEYGVKQFTANYVSKQISVEYYHKAIDALGNVMASEALSYIERTPERYQGLYNLNSFTEAAGDFYGKQCISGIMERSELAYRCFDSAGQLITPQ